jgi:hypothetical protein
LSNRVFWTPDGESCKLQADNFQKKKKPVVMNNRHFQLFSGDFVWGVLQLYGGVLIGKLVAYK